jgi:hypothetical protein
MMMIPRYIDNRPTEGCDVVSLTDQPRSTCQKYNFYVSGTQLCWGLSEHQGIVRPEGLGKFVNINYNMEPATGAL